MWSRAPQRARAPCLASIGSLGKPGTLWPPVVPRTLTNCPCLPGLLVLGALSCPVPCSSTHSAWQEQPRHTGERLAAWCCILMQGFPLPSLPPGLSSACHLKACQQACRKAQRTACEEFRMATIKPLRPLAGTEHPSPWLTPRAMREAKEAGQSWGRGGRPQLYTSRGERDVASPLCVQGGGQHCHGAPGSGRTGTNCAEHMGREALCLLPTVFTFPCPPPSRRENGV